MWIGINIAEGGSNTLVILWAVLVCVLMVGVIFLFMGHFLDNGLNWLQHKAGWFVGSSRMAWQPLSSMRKQITSWLRQNPEAGMNNINELLAYSLQFMVVVEAVDAWLNHLSPPHLLPAVNQLAQKPFDWDLLQFCSAPLDKALKHQLAKGFFIIPHRFKKGWHGKNHFELRLDTPARAACAGFWLLNQKNMERSLEAFAVCRELPHGAVFYNSVLALHEGAQAETLATVANWAESTNWLVEENPDPLRPTVLNSLKRLRSVAQEAAIAHESISQLNRSAALGRASAVLTELIEDVEETCTYPEWPLVKKIAVSWRDSLAKAAGEIGEIVISEPVRNPYVVGNPVAGQLFVGREPILKRLEELWGSDVAQAVPSVVLYGHRRMGKSSILQNLGLRFGTSTLVAQFTMQRLGKVRHTGELLHAFALTIFDTWEEQVVTDNGNSLAEPEATVYEGNGYTAFNRFLRTLKQTIGEDARVILTIDEFELIEKGIKEGDIQPEVLEFLRGVVHSEPWFILALAGLHTLQEMTEDYWNPLFASVTPVHVSFLSAGASAQLLANPTPDFSLDYTQDTANRVYRWVQGQPYLTQLVGHTLVRRYNQSVFEEGNTREPRFTAEDVDDVVMAPDFYEQGSYYFTGVWGQAERDSVPGQTEILQQLAQSDEPLAEAVLVAADEQATAALAVLQKHDVVTINTEKQVDFAVPLMRHWIRTYR